MTSNILILADQKSRRLSHKISLENLRPNSSFTIVKSYQQALDALNKDKFSLIVLDEQVCDAPFHRPRAEAIKDLKLKSNNLPIISIGTEMNHALKIIRDGADGFLPMNWLT